MSLARPAIAGAAAGLLALAGCGEKRETTTGGASGSGPAPASAMTISETEFKLDPGTLELQKSGAVTITVKNDGTTDHALEVAGPNGQVKTGTIAPGQTATLKADVSKAGTYEMFCPIDGHKDMGMRGEIKVAG